MVQVVVERYFRGPNTLLPLLTATHNTTTVTTTHYPTTVTTTHYPTTVTTTHYHSISNNSQYCLTVVLSSESVTDSIAAVPSRALFR